MSKSSITDFNQLVGEVVTFIGLKGVMKVKPNSNNPALFLDIKNVLLKLPNLKEENENNVQATVKDISVVKNSLQIQLNEYNSRTEVENFRNAQIFTLKSQLKELGNNQWWVKDLIGLEVYTTDDKLIGTVCDAPGEHGEFLEIKKANSQNGETTIVSFVKELFPVVDMQAKRIEVVDLPGLFE